MVEQFPVYGILQWFDPSNKSDTTFFSSLWGTLNTSVSWQNNFIKGFKSRNYRNMLRLCIEVSKNKFWSC